MKRSTENPLLVFDPGATTGFAALSGDGRVLFTVALILDEIEPFIELLDCILRPGLDVVIEKGPTRSNSPVTRRVEGKLLEAFPNAHLVQPSQWKGHPASRLSHIRFSTRHEQDAAGLGRWFYETRREDGKAEVARADVTARTDSSRTGR